MNALIIIAVVILAYYRTINYGYIIDDHDHVKKDVTPNKWLRWWEHIYGIKFTNLKLAHSLNILVHCMNCLLIYFVFGQSNISLLAAVLFAINPVNNQCSIWISGRPYAFSTMFLLLGMLCLPLMPFCYGVANWWTINTLFAPLLFLFLKPWWLALIMPIGLFLITEKAKNTLDAGKKRYAGATNEMGEISPKKLIIVFKTLGYYTLLCFFPIRLGMCHSYLSTFGMTKEETTGQYKPDVFFFTGLLVLGLAVSNMIWNFYPPLFWLLWFVVFTAQWLNFIVISHLITERYVYLANVGLMVLLANLIIGTPLAYIFLTFYAVRLFYFMPAYKNYVEYWKSNTENFPNVAMGWNQYGLGLLQYGNGGSALDAWVRGVQERPNDFRLNYNTANLLIGSGSVEQAVKFIKAAEENLDKKNNYDMWKGQIDKLKEEVKKRGINVDTL
jgi:hypothetical protein